MRFKPFRRLCLRLAFKGCKCGHADALAYADRIAGARSIENEITIERALELDYWAREIAK